MNKNKNSTEISDLFSKIGKSLEKKTEKKGSIKVDSFDYIRINTLYRKWWSLLWSTTYAYFFIYLSFQAFKIFLFKNFQKTGEDSGIGIPLVWKFFVKGFFVFLRGVIYSSDGIISSWLKTPFGQICYAINKSKIDESVADNMVTRITEINEHFKETFKKFGILNISEMTRDFCNLLADGRPLNGMIDDSEYWSASLAVPIVFAFLSSRDIKGSINELQILIKSVEVEETKD